MSLRHALLGILREGPASGYDLMQLFKVSLHNAWPATQSQIYTELAKLADAGLLTVTARGPRGRKEYTLTDDGLAELRRWLLETEPEPHRNEPMLRVFLLGALSRDQAREYLTYLEKRAAKYTGALEALDVGIDWDDGDLSFYGQLVLEYGKRLQAMNGEWAAWAATQIREATADGDPGVSAPAAGNPEPNQPLAHGSRNLQPNAVRDRSFHASHSAMRFAYSVRSSGSAWSPKKTRSGGSSASAIARIAAAVARGSPRRAEALIGILARNSS